MAELTLESLARRVEALERKLGATAVPDADPPGTTGDEQSNDPAAVARWVAAFDAIPPAVMTPAEEAAWQAERAGRKCADTAAIDRIVQTLPGSAG